MTAPTFAAALADQLLDRLPDAQPLDRETLSSFPLPVAHYLDRWLAQHVGRVESTLTSPWVEDADEVEAARAALVAVMQRHAQIPAERRAQVVRYAVARVVAHLIRPADTLVKTIEETGEGPYAAETILARLDWFTSHAALAEVVVSYFEWKGTEQLDADALRRLVRQIDQRLAQEEAPSEWIAHLAPLFDLAALLPGDQRRVPAALLRSHLDARSLASELLLDLEDDQALSEAELLALVQADSPTIPSSIDIEDDDPGFSAASDSATTSLGAVAFDAGDSTAAGENAATTDSAGAATAYERSFYEAPSGYQPSEGYTPPVDREADVETPSEHAHESEAEPSATEEVYGSPERSVYHTWSQEDDAADGAEQGGSAEQGAAEPTEPQAYSDPQAYTDSQSAEAEFGEAESDEEATASSYETPERASDFFGTSDAEASWRYQDDESDDSVLADGEDIPVKTPPTNAYPDADEFITSFTPLSSHEPAAAPTDSGVDEDAVPEEQAAAQEPEAAPTDWRNAPISSALDARPPGTEPEAEAPIPGPETMAQRPQADDDEPDAPAAAPADEPASDGPPSTIEEATRDDQPLWSHYAAPPAPSVNDQFAEPSEPEEAPAAAAEHEDVPLWKRFFTGGDSGPADTPEVATEAATGAEPAPAGAPAPEGAGGIEALERRLLGDAAEQRAWFVAQLTEGDEAAYDTTLRALDDAASWTEASQVIARDIFRRYRVNIYSAPAIAFTDAVEAHFRTERTR